MKEYNLDNIHEFFEELDNKLNPNIHKMMVWAGYQRDYDFQKELRKIEEIYEKPSMPENKYTAWKISYDMYVVQFVSKRMSGYFPHVVGAPKCNILFDTFEQAIIGCLAFKYTRSTEAVTWICKMLGI